MKKGLFIFPQGTIAFSPRSSCEMLVSPTEPKLLRDLGKVSSKPEKYGCDFLLPSAQFGLVGVQRKELQDLVASVQQGRLQEQVAKMRQLECKFLLLEGVEQWTSDGWLVGGQQWTMAQHLGVIWSAQLEGIWIGSSKSLPNTSQWLTLLSKWLAKLRHNGLSRRQKIKPQWGTRESKDWAIGVLSQIDGVSLVLAERIWEKFGLPIKWTIRMEDLVEVDGIGAKKAERIWRCLT